MLYNNIYIVKNIIMYHKMYFTRQLFRWWSSHTNFIAYALAARKLSKFIYIKIDWIRDVNPWSNQITSKYKITDLVARDEVTPQKREIILPSSNIALRVNNNNNNTNKTIETISRMPTQPNYFPVVVEVDIIVIAQCGRGGKKTSLG